MTSDELQFLATLESVISDRLANPQQDSYTSGLVALGPARIAQKVGEEAVELALASVAGKPGEIVEEAADLVYHLVVLLNANDISLGDVVRKLKSRHAG